MSINSVNRSWLAFRFFNVVCFVYNFRRANVNSVGPPTLLPQSLLGQFNMRTQDVTGENFASIIMCDSTRSQLLSAMRAESGSSLPLLNHVAEVAQRFKTNRKQLSQIVTAELDAECDDFLRDLVFHPEIDESTLFQVYNSGLCTVALAHRSGPPSLLERIAKKQRIEEAVLTLLLRYYATDDYTDSQFVQFVRAYDDIHGVRYELENKQNIPEHKRRLGLEALAEQPK